MKELRPVQVALAVCMNSSPSAIRPSVSITWPSAWWAHGSFRRKAIARRAAASASGMKWHCSQPKAAMPWAYGTSADAGSAASASRSIAGASPRLNAWYWPSLSDTRSRGCSVACSWCSAIARGTSPPTQAATAATKRRSRAVAPAQPACAQSTNGCAAAAPPRDSENICSAAQ